MPFISLKTNVKIEDKTALKSRLGELISIIPNKTEAVTMVSLEDEQSLYFGGSDDPCVIVETLVNKGSDHSKDKEYCDTLTDEVSKELNIPFNRIYTMVDEEDFWYFKR